MDRNPLSTISALIQEESDAEASAYYDILRCVLHVLDSVPDRAGEICHSSGYVALVWWLWPLCSLVLERPQAFLKFKRSPSQALDFMERWFQGQEEEAGLERMLPRDRQSLRMYFNYAIKAAGESGNLTKSVDWYQRMRAADILPSPRTFGKLIAAAANAGLVDEAESWLQTMEEEGFEPNMVAYCSMITACAKAWLQPRA
eukprot:symbB.v1.2.040087.t1/scaffold6980.1/size14089/3